jgi:riboflavin biosynthesis pyrimidine reductase
MELLHGVLLRAAARRMLLELRPASLHCLLLPASGPAECPDRSRLGRFEVFRSCYISTAISSTPINLHRLLPPGDPVSAQEIATGLGLHKRAKGVCGQALTGVSEVRSARPYVVLNMVSTLDGHATLDGRSGPLSDSADRELFHSLRSVVDAVMAGAGTMRAERYGPIVPDADRRHTRARLGLKERPLACVVSGSLALPPDLPLLADPDSPVAIVTPSDGRLAETAARVEYVRARTDAGALDLGAALAELQDRLHVRTVLCEGGPHLNWQLLSAGLVDELFLSISPLLGGGRPVTERGVGAGEATALGILAGAELHPPLELKLLSVFEHDSRLFLRYRVRARG